MECIDYGIRRTAMIPGFRPSAWKPYFSLPLSNFVAKKSRHLLMARIPAGSNTNSETLASNSVGHFEFPQMYHL